MRAVLASDPQGEAFRGKIAEWSEQRFIGAVAPPPPPPSLAATGKLRYFGAR
ncbi:MAG: hypothetical protein H6Q10_1153 [Acidobacteria bacterium]|nr:hypothetical protein [Acidobacteriota bacterium]